MSQPSDKKLGAALATAIQELVTEQDSITIPNWGTLEVVHEKSRVEEADDRIIIHPPKDVLQFEPDPSL